MKKNFYSVCLMLLCLAGGFVGKSEGEELMGSSNKNINFVESNTNIKDIINYDKFEGFGNFIFPINNRMVNTTLNNIDFLLPYHSNINTKTSVEVINYMINKVNDNETIFYDIYSEEEKSKNQSKKDTGLFFFKGNPNASFAIIVAGGGFSYVGSIHESFPHALAISKRGYNAFVLQYRTNANAACEDLARAISFIFENAEKLNVDTSNYSLWGGSAGARVAAYLGSYGPQAFGGNKELPKPISVIMQYTGHSDYNDDEPATFVVVGKNDWIADWKVMESRVNILKRQGIETEFHVYPNLGHGFGLGINTTAEGWIDKAIAFWQKQIDKKV